MIMKYMLRDARPSGVHTLDEVWQRCADGERPTEPLLVKASGGNLGARFQYLAPMLPWGSVVCFESLSKEDLQRVTEVADKYEWRTWSPAGCEPGETMFVRSHYDGGTYATHQPYLIEAVKCTTGPVLELGAGEGSTPVLHDLLQGSLRKLVTVDNDLAYIEKFTHLMTEQHAFEHLIDPATTEWLSNVWRWGVVFVDHAPGETRARAVERARDKADFVICHDTEDPGYQTFDLLETFKFKKHFRYARPWTTVASMTREIFESPIAAERF